MNKIVNKVQAYKSNKENANHYSAYLDRLTFMSFEENNTIFNINIKILKSIIKSNIGL